MTIPPAERPLVDCSVWWRFIFGVGVACLFLLQGFSSTSNRRISKGKVPRFLHIYTNGAFGANVPTNQSIMKKMYQSPCTVLCHIETSILCASGVANTSANGSLESIGKGNGEW